MLVMVLFSASILVLSKLYAKSRYQNDFDSKRLTVFQSISLKSYFSSSNAEEIEQTFQQFVRKNKRYRNLAQMSR